MVTNLAIAKAFARGMSVNAIARLYEIDNARVENAIRFYLYRRK